MIDPKIKEAWLWAQKSAAWEDLRIIADAYIDAEAGRRMLEFWSKHCVWPGGCSDVKIIDGVIQPCTDPRHNWTVADWRAELIGEIEK